MCTQRQGYMQNLVKKPLDKAQKHDCAAGGGVDGGKERAAIPSITEQGVANANLESS